MQWVLDIGNTHYKWGLFEGESLNQVLSARRYAVIDARIRQTPDAHGLISTVRKPLPKPLARLVASKPSSIYVLDSTHHLPFALRYETKETLGMDRIAAVAGARAMFPEDHVLVISVGTCITYTFYDPKKGLIGGNITPGMAMRARALARDTDALPHVSLPYQTPLPLIGRHTHEAIQTGILNGAKAEIQGLIQAYVAQYPTLKCVLCGTGVKSFSIMQLKSKKRIFIQENLILLGLRVLLNHLLRAPT